MIKGIFDKKEKVKLKTDKGNVYLRKYTAWQNSAVIAEKRGFKMQEWFKNNPAPVRYEDLIAERRRLLLNW